MTILFLYHSPVTQFVIMSGDVPETNGVSLREGVVTVWRS